ncbi:MAG: hypothetical protein KAQ85_07690 [Thermodesulfovibrionia bacterium]|nr:hypothetical protein [Thermodesulfovibrionia bacterium]
MEWSGIRTQKGNVHKYNIIIVVLSRVNTYQPVEKDINGLDYTEIVRVFQQSRLARRFALLVFGLVR